MSAYKTDQRRVLHRGREYHFVSYEGRQANAGRGEDELPPSWCVMIAGRRLMVTPQQPGQTDADLDHELRAWLDANVSAVPGR